MATAGWHLFATLKEGYDTFADDYGYFHLDDDVAMSNLSVYLGLDKNVVREQMRLVDLDENHVISFAEFALWADKHTVGKRLGIDVADKRAWWNGVPRYWDVYSPDPPPEDVEPPSAPAASERKVIPLETDVGELQTFIQAAKEFRWGDALTLLKKYPGYVNMRPEQRMYGAVHQSAYSGNIDMARTLVEEYGADPTLKDKEGNTPEQVARAHGMADTADFFESAVRKVNAPPVPARTRGRPCVAPSEELVTQANLIIEQAKWRKWEEMFAHLAASRECVNVRPMQRRYAAIHQVAYAGDVVVLKRLVEEFGADPLLLTKDAETPQQVAEKVSNLDAAAYLVSKGSCVPVASGATDSNEKKAHDILDAARQAQWDKMFKLLEAYPELVNVRPERRQYACIHQAAYHAQMKVLRRLIEDFKADTFLKSKDGFTPVEIAINQSEVFAKEHNLPNHKVDEVELASSAHKEEYQRRQAAIEYLQACNVITLDDDFVKFPEQRLVRLKEAELGTFRNLLAQTHKASQNWTRDRKMASGFFDAKTPVPIGYELVAVYRNENPALWRVYEVSREVMKLHTKKHIAEMPEHQAWTPLTMDGPLLSWLGQDVSKEVNEWYLLHASGPEALRAVARKGFTMRTVGQGAVSEAAAKGMAGGLYGNGVYFTDSITKTDEYARKRVEGSPDHEKELDGCRTAALVRVLGGRHFYTDQETKQEDKPEFQKRIFEGNYNSTVGDRLKLKNTFREYVAYDASSTYLEYIIYYRRQHSAPVDAAHV